MTTDQPSPPLNRRDLAAAAAGATLAAMAAGGAASPAFAQQASAQQVPGAASYRLIGRWDVERLNRILTVDTPAFTGFPVTYSPARNAVRLYRVSYPSVVPERGNRPVMLSGLLAIPEVGGTTLPLVSYQHGTVYGKQEVPSFPEHSPETQLMIAQFAGQGYAMVGADYVGMGESAEPQGYMVKESHQQATADLIPAARGVLAANGLSAPKLFIAGWSQGGWAPPETPRHADGWLIH